MTNTLFIMLFAQTRKEVFCRWWRLQLTKRHRGVLSRQQRFSRLFLLGPVIRNRPNQGDGSTLFRLLVFITPVVTRKRFPTDAACASDLSEGQPGPQSSSCILGSKETGLIDLGVGQETISWEAPGRNLLACS